MSEAREEMQVETMDRTPAEVFPPGEFIREELEARGWSEVELAEILGHPARLVSELIAGEREITPETAEVLGEALHTGGQFWMNLESSYRLAQAAPIRGNFEERGAMKEPGLDNRHRDKTPPIAGEIQQKRSDTLNKNLPKSIPQFSPNAKLGTMRAETGKTSVEAVRRAAQKIRP